MRFEFNRAGAERKALVQAMGESLEVKPRYLGMPTTAYEVDYFHIDRTGAVEFDDRADSEEIENLMERLAERGIVAAPAETAQEGDTAEETAEPEKPCGSTGNCAAGGKCGAYSGNAEGILHGRCTGEPAEAGGRQGQPYQKCAGG